MARVPRAADIGVSSFNVGTAAQIDIGVAKNIGAAGNAIGQAVAALGGAFGELAGRVQATEQATAYSGLVNDLYDADAKIEADAIKNAAPDGSHWDGAGTQYGEASEKWRQDPRWNVLSPKQKAQAENAHRGLTRRRAIGPDSYLERSRKDKVNFQTGKVGEAVEGSLTRLSPEADRNVGIAPQVFDERVEAEKELVFSRIDEMTGTVFSPAQAEKAKEQAAQQFALTKLQWLQKNDPAAAEKFFDGYQKLERDEIKEPAYLGGPGSKSEDAATGNVDAGPDAPDYRGKKGPAAIRYNNPGAMWPGPSSKKFGAVGSVNLKDGQGNKIAVFPTAVHGAAAQFDLLSRRYTGKTLASAIKTWSGGNSVGTYLKVLERETGISSSTKLTKAMIADPRIAIPLAKAMGVQEAGKPFPMSDKGWSDAHAMFTGNAPVSVAETKPDLPAGKMTLGAGDVANATQAADAAGIDIAKLAELSPETTLGDALSEEEITAIQARAPEGVNVREVTVAEAGELIGQATGGAPQTMNDAGPQQLVQAREPMRGNVKEGQQLTVPSGNGFMKFDARELRALPKSLLKDMEKQFTAKRRAATKATSDNAKEMMKNQEESLDKTFTDTPGYDKGLLDKAFPRGTPEREKHERSVAVSRQLGKIFADDASVSALELKERMEALAPANVPEGADGAVYAELRKKAEERLDNILDLRAKDPAKAVEKHPIVTKTMAGFEGGRPRNAEDRVKLARARMAAQKDIGIDSWNRTPIDDGEARSYVNDLDKLPDDQLEAGLTELMAKVKKQYGEEHSGVVLNAIVREMTKTDERKAHLVNEARRISDRDALGLGPYDIDSANEMYDMEGVEKKAAVMYRGGSARARERMFQEAQKSAGAAAPAAAPRDKFYPRGAPSAPPASTIKPSKDDLASLQSGSLSPEAFAKKYGLSLQEAESALLGLITNSRPRN